MNRSGWLENSLRINKEVTMFGGLANLAKLMSNPQAIQQQAQEMRNKLAASRITGESVEGHVQVVVTGDFRVLEVQVSEELSNLAKPEIEQHILAACAEALIKARQMTTSEMSQLTQSLGLPGLDKFLQM